MHHVQVQVETRDRVGDCNLCVSSESEGAAASERGRESTVREATSRPAPPESQHLAPDC